jgi:hypothetical protein
MATEHLADLHGVSRNEPCHSKKAGAIVTETTVCDSEWYQKAPGKHPKAFPALGIWLIYAESEEATSGLEPLT